MSDSEVATGRAWHWSTWRKLPTSVVLSGGEGAADTCRCKPACLGWRSCPGQPAAGSLCLICSISQLRRRCATPRVGDCSQLPSSSQGLGGSSPNRWRFSQPIWQLGGGSILQESKDGAYSSVGLDRPLARISVRAVQQQQGHILGTWADAKLGLGTLRWPAEGRAARGCARTLGTDEGAPHMGGPPRAGFWV